MVSLLTGVVYKSISNLITPVKDQVKGPLITNRQSDYARFQGALQSEFDNVASTYDGQARALDGITISVEQGEFLCVLGGNGSGKSTLAKHINALLVPDEGTVRVLDRNTADPANTYFIRSNAGMVFQNPDDQMVASVIEDDVAFGPENLGVPTDELRVRVTEALAQVGLQGFENKETARFPAGRSNASPSRACWPWSRASSCSTRRAPCSTHAGARGSCAYAAS